MLLLLLAFVLAAEEIAPIPVTNQNRLNPDDVLAEYDGGVITRRDLDAKISKIPPNAQGRYRTVDGQIQVLDIMAVEEAFMAKALQLGIDQDPEVLEKIAAGTRQFYLQEYYKRNVSDLLVVTEADKQRYYNENKQAFYLFPYLSISYIQAQDEASALLALAELNQGKPFAEVSDQYNINTYAKGLKGVIKNIRLNGNIPGVGNDLDLEKYIAESTPDSLKVYGPYKTASGWHIFRTNEYVPGRQKEYSEVQNELEQRARPGVENRLLDELTSRLKLQYAVVIDTALVARIDLQNPVNNSDIENQNVVTSINPELNLSVRQILDSFGKISPQEQLFYVKGGGAAQLVDQELVRALLYADAVEKDYAQYLADNEEYKQMKRYYILNKTFRVLVVDTIEVSSDDTRAYYQAHLADYTTPTSRAIEILWFDKEKAGNKALRTYKRYVKLNDEKKIAELIQKKSTRAQTALLDNIYNNGIITGIGPDEDFSKRVWDNPVGYVSPVFTTARGDIVFFRILRENPPTVKTFTETEPRIYGVLKKEKEAGQQEKVTQELFQEFNMMKYPERISLQLSAEELFNLADNSARQRNFNDAITFYDQIIKNYPNGNDDYRASFMKAFLVAEELKNEALALDLFKAFLRKYPTGDLNESAQFMIDSLEGNVQLEIEEE
jgi:hypothetical protein